MMTKIKKAEGVIEFESVVILYLLSQELSGTPLTNVYWWGAGCCRPVPIYAVGGRWKNMQWHAGGAPLGNDSRSLCVGATSCKY